MEYPTIKLKGENYFEIGCKTCDINKWKIAMSESKKLIAVCLRCGKIINNIQDSVSEGR